MSKTCYVDHILRHALVLPNNKMVSELLFPPLMLCLHLPASHSYILGHMKAFMAQEKSPSFLQHVMQKVRVGNPNDPWWPYEKKHKVNYSQLTPPEKAILKNK